MCSGPDAPVTARGMSGSQAASGAGATRSGDAAGVFERRVAWFHCFSGVAGDMVLGALVDAGADVAAVRDIVAGLRLPGWDLRVEPATRGGIGATRVVVDVPGDDPTPRPFADLARLVEEASLPDRVAERALAALRALAAAESRVHRVPIGEVHLHELGGHDTLVDVVGSAAALEILGVDEIVVSPIAVGTGTLRGAHGPLPNPSPAVVELLRNAPVVGRDTAIELTTPTGAALMATWSTGFGPMPAMRISAAGFGAGTADLPGVANCVQVVIGDRSQLAAALAGPMAPADEAAGAGAATRRRPGVPAGLTAPGDGRAREPDDEPGQPVVLLETTVDDATGETLAYTVDVLLQTGALDAWITPVVMKRGRPGHVVSALAEPRSVPELRRVLHRETGTLGVRAARLERWPAERTVDVVEVSGHRVRLKVSAGRVKAEHRDAASAARALDLPVREVAFAAESAWRRANDPVGGGAGV